MKGIGGIATLFLSFTVRYLTTHRVKTVLTVVGIALGVAIQLAVQLANTTAITRFRESVDLVSGRVNLEIRPNAVADFDAALLEDLQWLWLSGCKYTPVVEATVMLPGESREIVQVLGVDMLADADYRPYRVNSRSGESRQFELFGRGKVLVGEKLARSRRLTPGSEFTVLANDREVKVKVAGVLSGDGLGQAFGGNLIIMDVASAQDTFGLGNRISRIDVIAPSEVLAEVAQTLSSRVPPTLTVATPARRGDQVHKMVRAFEYNLTALSFVALLVGMFLIYNSMSISVLSRRSEIGILRALGVTRAQIFALFAVESLILGVLGAALGAGCGIVLSEMTVKAVSRTVETLYVDNVAGAVVVDLGAVAVSFAFGVALTFLASLPPLLEASTVAPATACRRDSHESKVAFWAGGLAFAGLLVWLLAAWTATMPPVGGLPVFGYVAAFLAIAGAAMIMPLFVRIALSSLGRMLQGSSAVASRLAAASLLGASGRTAVAVASLMVGIAMMVSLAIMIGSFRETVVTWINQTLKADLWVEPAARKNGRHTVRLSRAAIAAIAVAPAVAAVDPFFQFPIEFNGEPTYMGVGDFDVLRRFGRVNFIDGESLSAVLDRIDRHPGALVTESFALRHGIGKGETISLPSPSGPLRLTVEGVYYDYASDRGFIVVSSALYERYFGPETATSLAVYLKDGADLDLARRQIVQSVPAGTRLSISTNRELRSEVLRIFDDTFAITYALHGIAIAVAMLGVVNTLYTLTVASGRDLGIIRYLGASRRQMRGLVLSEAAYLGIMGIVAGMVVGFILSFVLIFVINKQSFGWTVRLSVPYAFLAQSTLLIVLASVVAGLVPARIAARIVAPSAVRSE